tara:strand:+ start:295 stop:612 length:318 start_codon:yes stop_codon:yes gene_type:complete
MLTSACTEPQFELLKVTATFGSYSFPRAQNVSTFWTSPYFLRREYPTRKKRGERGNSLVYAPFKLPPHSPLSPPPPRRRLRPRRDRKKGKKENNNEKEEEKDMEG